jgi:hypothetical protein
MYSILSSLVENLRALAKKLFSLLEQTESIATLPPFGPIVFPDFQPMKISEDPVALISFGKI